MASEDGVVTAIEPVKGKAGRVTVYVAGSVWAELDAELAKQFGLAVGGVVTAEQRRSLVAQDLLKQAQDRAVRLLEVRERSRWEVQIRLHQAGFPPHVTAQTLDRLESLGYLNDARFAWRYAQERYKKGYGLSRIRSELGRRGITRELADQALEQVLKDDSVAGGQQVEEPLGPIMEEVRRRFGRPFAEDRQKTSKRVASFLLRRGHDWDVVHRVIRVLEQETEDSLGSPDGEDWGP